MFRDWFVVLANDKAKARRTRGARFARRPDFAGYVVNRLYAGLSPQQIAELMHLARSHGLS